MAPHPHQSFGSGELRFVVPTVIGALALLIYLGSQTPHPVASASTSQSAFVTSGKPKSWHGLPNPMSEPEATAATVQRLAERTGGNYDLLSDDEKTFMEVIGAGEGRAILKNTAQF